MNNHTNNDAEHLSSEECELLRSTINMAYPKPKGSIRDRVMAQIASETRRRKRMNRFLRYGSIAACLILTVGIVLGIAPSFDNMSAEKADMTDADANTAGTGMIAMFSYVAEDEAGAAEDAAEPEIMKSAVLTAEEADMLRDTAETAPARFAGAPTEEIAEAPAEAALTEAAVAGATVAEADGDDLEEAQAEAMEYALQSDATVNYAANSVIECTMHSADMHDFCHDLIAYVGEDTFDGWYASAEATDECGLPSVRRMAEHFGIDRETFEKIASDCGIDYDLARIFPD